MLIEMPQKGDVAIASKAINVMPGLSANARRVAGAILDHFNHTTGRCDPSVDRLAKLLGINRSTVLRATAEICSGADALFQKRSHGGHANCASYQPIWQRFRQLVIDWDHMMKGSSSDDVEREPEPENVAELRPRTSQECNFKRRKTATQTNYINQSKEPIIKPSTEIVAPERPKPQSVADADTPQYGLRMKENRKQQISMMLPLRGGRQVSHEVAALEAAKGRIDRWMMQNNPDGYAFYVDHTTPEMLDRAAGEDVRSKGAGKFMLMNELAALGLRQSVGGAA